MSSNEQAPRHQAILDVPLHRHLGLVYEDSADGVANAWFDVGPQLVAFGGLHGGVHYLLMDAVAMLALLPLLEPDQHAVTHDLHASVIRPVAPGARVRLCGRVVRRGRNLAFIDVTAQVDGEVVASARVTKSLTSHRAP